MRPAARDAFVVGLAALLATACSIGEATHEKVVVEAQTQNETRTCDSPFASPDLASLPECGAERGSKGHCFDSQKLPVTGLLACDGDKACVPDKILTAKGGQLKSCTFFIENKPGVCLSLLSDDVFQHKGELQKDVCDDDERCIPCIDPTNGQDTHMCEPIGVHDKACTGGLQEAADSCCHGNGTCIREDGLPEDSRGQLSREICPDDQVCAPRALVDGKPVTCDVLGVAGVCLDVCFATMIKPAGQVLRSSCGPTEICLPCAIGKGQGMPGCD